MRDIIWTIIVIWLIYKLIDIFKSVSGKKTSTTSGNQNNDSQQGYAQNTSTPKHDIKSAVQKHLNHEGEYVDFEEIK